MTVAWLSGPSGPARLSSPAPSPPSAVLIWLNGSASGVDGVNRLGYLRRRSEPRLQQADRQAGLGGSSALRRGDHLWAGRFRRGDPGDARSPAPPRCAELVLRCAHHDGMHPAVVSLRRRPGPKLRSRVDGVREPFPHPSRSTASAVGEPVERRHWPSRPRCRWASEFTDEKSRSVEARVTDARPGGSSISDDVDETLPLLKCQALAGGCRSAAGRAHPRRRVRASPGTSSTLA